MLPDSAAISVLSDLPDTDLHGYATKDTTCLPSVSGQLSKLGFLFLHHVVSVEAILTCTEISHL